MVWSRRSTAAGLLAFLASACTALLTDGRILGATRDDIVDEFELRGRELLQQNVVPRQVEVDDANGLFQAIADGETNIVVIQHIDLSTIEPAGAQESDALVTVQKGRNLTIRGNCDASKITTGVIIDVAQLALADNACVIMSAGPVIAIEGNAWFQNLAFRLVPGRDGPLPAGSSLINVIGSGQFWAIDCAFEGDGVASLSGLSVDLAAKALVKDSVFRHLGGDTSVIQVYSALSLVDCLFTQNLLTQTDLGVPLALIRLIGDLFPNGIGPSLRMEAVSAINNPHPFTVSATVPEAVAEVYSDFPVSIVILEGPIENPSAPNKDFKPLRSQTLQDLDYIEQPGVKRFLSERTPEFLVLQDNAGPLLPPGEPLEDFEDYEQLPETGLPQTALAPAQVTRVSTANQLLSAVAAGDRDILIVAHIDLFEAPTDDLGFIMALQPTTRSIRGSCQSTDPVPVGIRDFGEQLLEMDNGECILSAEHGIFRLMQDNHYLWLDRLYLRSAPRGSMEYGREHRLLDVDGDGSKVWVSVCTLQGKENYGEAVMLWSQTGAVHFEESRLADFIVPRMSRSIFTTWGVLSMAAVDRERLQAPMNDTGVFFARDSGSIVVMATEECFNCVGNQFMVQDGGYVAADQAEVLLWDFTTQQEEQAIKIPEGQRPRDMLTMGDPWRVALQQLLDEETIRAATAPQAAPGQPQPVLPPLIQAPQAKLDVISTRAAFLDAIAKGERDIVIGQHLDLRDLDLNDYGYILSPKRTTRAILGGLCPAVPTEMLSEGDVAWRTEVSPGQCVILVDAGLFFIDEPNHHLWIDNLFIRFQSTGAVANESDVVVGNNGDELSGDPRGIVVASRGASVYCTNLSFMVAIDSLAGGFKVAALWDDASRLYFQVLNMYNFAVRQKQPAVISTWGQLAIDEAQLTNAFVGDGLALFRTENFGGLRVADLNITDEFGPGAVYISPVALAGVSANSGVFCNDKTQVHVSAFGPPEPCQPLNKVQDEDAFASANDVWFTATKEAIDPALDFLEDSLDAPPAVDGDEPLAPPADTSAGDTGDIAASTNRDSQQQPQAASVGGGSSGGGKNGTRIALIAVFGTLFPLIIVALAVWVVHRRHSRREAWAEFNDGLPKEIGAAKIPLDATDATWASAGLDRSDNGELSMRSLGVHTAAAELSGSNGSSGDGLGPNPSGPASFPGGGSGKDPTTQVTPLAPLTLALDALCANRGKLLDKYTPLGLAHRRLGRTAVVQIFEDPDTHRRYAIKFFRSRTSFDCERAAYGRTAVAEAVAVPQHGIVTEPGTGPDGYRWPPCIVMDVGEPVDVFLARVPRGDDATIRTALADIAAVIETLHSKGWAHRNLKPSNVLFLPETERWVLCDLERCSRVGQTAPPSPPCEYTAPEVWTAMQTAQPSTVTAAADVWTVGALMFEAATGERVQQAGQQARAAAKGLYERAQAADGNGMLGALHEMILDCLAVAPAARPTIRSIVPLLQAEVIEAKQNIEHVLDQLQALSEDAKDYDGLRGYLQTVRACNIVPEPARSNLPEAPEVSPGGAGIAKLTKDYCMALGPDAVTFAKGIALRDERLHAFKSMNYHINDMVRRIAE